MNISFTNKILFGFIAVFFLSVLGHLFVMGMSSRVHEASLSILDIQRADFLLNKMEETVKIEGRLSKRYEERRDTALYAQFTLNANAYQGLVEELRLKTFWADIDLRSAFNTLVAHHNDFFIRFNSGVNRDGAFSEEAFREALQKGLDQLSNDFLGIHMLLRQRIEGKTELLADALHNMNRAVLVLLLVTIVVAVALCVFVTRSILAPFRKLLMGTRKIGEGHFDYDLEMGSVDDEVRELIEAFDQMARQLKKYRDNLIQTERFNAIHSIATSVSHEVNNPLTIISGNAEYVRTIKAGGDLELREKMAVILKEVERISDITQKLSQIKQILVEDYTLSSSKEWGKGRLIDIDGSAKPGAV